jgi:hypothetical protein
MWKKAQNAVAATLKIAKLGLSKSQEDLSKDGEEEESEEDGGQPTDPREPITV